MMTINGRTWPHTERFDIRVGDTVSWRWLNPTASAHPMHLHGVYYTVTSRGAFAADTTYSEGQERLVVTETMMPGSTFAMRWSPEQEGNWLFHCHFGFHVSHFLSFNRIPDFVDPGAHDAVDHSINGMRGLVLGIHARRRSHQPAVERMQAEARPIRMVLTETPDRLGDQPGYIADVEPAAVTMPVDSAAAMGEPLLLHVGERVAITIVNHMRAPSAIHWHGMEIESYPDGVPGWSGSGVRIAQAIAPADSFIAEFTPQRAGTFIYHSHSNEGYQISSGIYGPLIVLDSTASFDAERDKWFVVGGNGFDNTAGRINGYLQPAPVELVAGRTYRFRMISIHPERRVILTLRAGPPDSASVVWSSPQARPGTTVSWRPIAKDGADLPALQGPVRPASIAMGTGETADFAFTPSAGEYTLEVVSQLRGWVLQVPIAVPR
jgi:FtsP/CotA-like multicopper oxidase with cupredoxin domain